MYSDYFYNPTECVACLMMISPFELFIRALFLYAPVLPSPLIVIRSVAVAATSTQGALNTPGRDLAEIRGGGCLALVV